MNFVAVLNRIEEDDRQTVGVLTILNGVHVVLSCYTIELPFRHNDPFKSCIPAGRYLCRNRHSDRWGNHWHVTDVAGRSLILIHSGNFHWDTQGCILPGRDIVDIDGDGHKDVTSSAQTMRAINNAISAQTFELNIYPALHRAA